MKAKHNFRFTFKASALLLFMTTAILVSSCEKESPEPPAPPPAAPTAPPSGSGSLCTNTCAYAYDGECDDGGPGAMYSLCAYGTDCSDCGPRSTGGGGGGGGGSTPPTGSSTARIMFWSAVDHACGTITVTQVGTNSTRTVTVYSTTGVPSCGTSGFANYELSPGTYTFSASCSGKSWPATTYTLSAGQCRTVQLT